MTTPSCGGTIVKDGQLTAGGNSYRALVFGPGDYGAPRPFWKKALALAESGGTVLFCQQLPESHGRGRPGRRRQLAALWEKPVRGRAPAAPLAEKSFPNGGYLRLRAGEGWRPLPDAYRHAHIDARLHPRGRQTVYATHRRVGRFGHLSRPERGSRRGHRHLRPRFRVAVACPKIWDTFHRRASNPWFRPTSEMATMFGSSTGWRAMRPHLHRVPSRRAGGGGGQATALVRKDYPAGRHLGLLHGFHDPKQPLGRIPLATLRRVKIGPEVARLPVRSGSVTAAARHGGWQRSGFSMTAAWENDALQHGAVLDFPDCPAAAMTIGDRGTGGC